MQRQFTCLSHGLQTSYDRKGYFSLFAVFQYVPILCMRGTGSQTDSEVWHAAVREIFYEVI